MNAMPARPVTLQVSLTPDDLEQARHFLPHQLKQWAGQVEEVLCTVDVWGGPDGAPGVPQPVEGLQALFSGLRRSYPHLRWEKVDYSAAAQREIGDAFYGGHAVPLRDHRRRPIYAYLFGLRAASRDVVFHIDADMIFGGGSQSWMGEACDLLHGAPEVLTCSPLPGPPRQDGRLLAQRQYAQARGAHGLPSYRFPTLSTRLFVVDRRKLTASLAPLPREWPPLRPALRVLLSGRRPHATLEEVLSRRMAGRGLSRVDFLGAEPGMWAIHPLHRSGRFPRLLPELIRRVEAGEVHESQRGHYDVTEGTLDWIAEARPAGPGAGS